VKRECNVLVTVWRGESHVAVISVTDVEYLEALRAWIAEQEEYRITEDDGRGKTIPR
jgi:hypothetical protein